MAASIGAETALLDFVMQPVRIFDAIGWLVAVRDDGFDNERVLQFARELATMRAVIFCNVHLLSDFKARGSGITAPSILRITEARNLGED